MISGPDRLPCVVAVVGPTATGKTALAIELSRAFSGEVVSADSMQIYRGMDIGTAKPGPAERQGIVHHMLDIVGPEEDYSVSRYVKDASRCIEDIYARGKLPVVAGGTGLYVDALLSGRTFAAYGEDKSLRDELFRLYQEKGGEFLLDILREFDPESAKRLHRNDARRIVRAIEVFRVTGKTITWHNEETKKIKPRYHVLKLGLNIEPRELLYAYIDERTGAMIAAGLEDEVRRLLNAGIPASATAMQAIGYKEFVRCIAGECSEEETAETIARETRQYAKRQLTWFRRDDDIRWLIMRTEADRGDNLLKALELTDEFLHKEQQ